MALSSSSTKATLALEPDDPQAWQMASPHRAAFGKCLDPPTKGAQAADIRPPHGFAGPGHQIVQQEDYILPGFREKRNSLFLGGGGKAVDVLGLVQGDCTLRIGLVFVVSWRDLSHGPIFP